MADVKKGDSRNVKKEKQVLESSFDHLTIIEKPLLTWFSKNARDLPWRRTKSPYHIWISEIMLQQTRVEAVISYYHRFLQELPTIKALATVSDEKLLKLWEGLGYYNRAKNLKKTAILLVEAHHGMLPPTYDELLTLPGIGPYTAGAIASIAYGERVPAVDGNVYRVFSRLLCEPSDVTLGVVQKSYRNAIFCLIPAETPGTYNEAIMELGATVCIPNGAPKCEICPLKEHCSAYESTSWMDYPYKTPKKPRKILEKTVLLLKNPDSKIYLRKRCEKGVLEGLWEFPSLEGFYTKKALTQLLTEKGLTNFRLEPAPKSKHIFTHLEWHMQGYFVYLTAAFPTEKESAWVSESELLKSYALPSAFKQYKSVLF